MGLGVLVAVDVVEDVADVLGVVGVALEERLVVLQDDREADLEDLKVGVPLGQPDPGMDDFGQPHDLRLEVGAEVAGHLLPEQVKGPALDRQVTGHAHAV